MRPGAERAFEWPAALWPLFLASTACISWAASRISGPFIFMDEPAYVQLARGVLEGSFLGAQYNPLYPSLLAPLLRLDGMDVALDAIKVLNAACYSAIVFPCFHIARTLGASEGRALAAALAAVLLPTAALVSSLRATQDLLGELHDLDVLRGHAARARREVPPDTIVDRDLAAMVADIDAGVRQLHARYLRAAPGLVRLTDRLRDRVTPCLAPSIST